MNYKELNKQIKEKNIGTVYLFYGEEEYLIDYFIKELKEAFIPKGVESLNFITLDGENASLDTIYNACETLPFMSEKRIVVVKDLNIFSRQNSKSKGDKNFEQKERKKLEDYISNLDRYICVVFVEKGEKADKSRTIVKTINKLGGLVEFDKLKGRDLDIWIEKAFRKQNKKISKANINYFVQVSSYFDTNVTKTLYDLENEINKLSNYVGNESKITKEDIEKIVAKSLERNIFKLLDGLSRKDIDSSLKIFNEMCLSNEPVQLILHMIIRQFRLLLMYKVLKEKGYDDRITVGKMKISPYEFRKISGQSRNFSICQLENALKYCLKADKKIKTSSVDNKMTMEVLLIDLCA